MTRTRSIIADAVHHVIGVPLPARVAWAVVGSAE